MDANAPVRPESRASVSKAARPIEAEGKRQVAAPPASKAPAPRPTAKPAHAGNKPKPSEAVERIVGKRGGPVGRMQTALATAIQADPEWKEF